MAQKSCVASIAGEERRAMRATLLQNYQRARTRIRVDEQHRKRVRTFIVYVLFVLLLLTILVQTTGFSLSQMWLKIGAKQDKGNDNDIASNNMSQVVIPLPDNVSCRYVWHDRQTLQIRKSITGPCNKDNKPPETKFAPTRNDFSWGGGRK